MSQTKMIPSGVDPQKNSIQIALPPQAKKFLIRYLGLGF